MAVLLIMMKRDVGPAIRNRSPYWPERGDVVAILPAGTNPGTKVTPENGFYLIEVNMSRAEAAQFEEEIRDPPRAGTDKGLLIRYRRRKMDLDDFPQRDREELERGKITRDRSEVETRVIDKATPRG